MTVQLGLWDSLGEASLQGSGIVVRASRRARHLILQVVPPHTLEVVVPLGTRPREVMAFVAENQAWIEQARADIGARGRDGGLPARIDLMAIGQSYCVAYRHRPGRRASLKAGGGELEICSAYEDFRETPALLRRWLLDRARRYLKPWLWQEAGRLDLKPRRIQVRLQRTRWGSCSSQGNISLNASLLLVQPPAARYLLVHELCHLRWLSHSKRYWRLVEAAEPDYRRLDRELNAAWTALPDWVLKAMQPPRSRA